MKKKFGQALLLLASCIVSLAIVEAFLWAIDYQYTPLRIETINKQTEWRYFHAFEDKHFVYDPVLIWRPRSDLPPFNRQGYRGPELADTKKSNAIRIFAIGDSNTLGWLDDEEGNWPEELQKILAVQNPEVEVVNAGVYGYSSYQGLRRLREAVRFEPDIVLISFGLNDAARVTVADEDFIARRVRTLGIDRALIKFRVGQLILAASDQLFGRKKSGLVRRVDPPKYAANLREMADLCRERGFRLIFLTRPVTGESPEWEWWDNFDPAYNAMLLKTASELGVPAIDVYTYFKDKEEHFADETHFTLEGHRLMARLISERIQPLIDEVVARRRSRLGGLAQ